MKNEKNKSSLTFRLREIRDKLRGATGKQRKNVDCEKMKIENSKELNPDDFE